MDGYINQCCWLAIFHEVVYRNKQHFSTIISKKTFFNHQTLVLYEKILCGPGPHKWSLVTQREKRKEREERRERKWRREKRRERRKKLVCATKQKILGGKKKKGFLSCPKKVFPSPSPLHYSFFLKTIQLFFNL
jgi:hypothetical protein